jgi:hypothetical protein
VFENPSPGAGQNVDIFTGKSGICTSPTLVGDVNPPTVGQFVVPFDPGLGIPAGSVLSAICFGKLACEVYVDGFVVASDVVPSDGVTASVVGPSRQNR